MTCMVQRQAPEVVPALNAANEAYGRAGIVRDAVNAARNGARSGEGGLFMPSQLADAASRNSRRFGGNQATPDQPFYELTSAARDVLPSRVPDSGTTGRLTTLLLPGALAGTGGAAEYAGADGGLGTGLAAGALLAAGGSRGGQNLLVRALLDRPDAAIRAGQALQRNNRVGGIFGAALLPASIQPLLAGQ